MIAQNSLMLATCKVSGITSKIMEFQMTLSSLSQQHGERALRNPTHQLGGSGCFGVIRQRLIPYPLQTFTGPVLNFLTAQFQEGKRYSTLTCTVQHYLLQCLKQMGNQLDSIQCLFAYFMKCSVNALLHPDTRRYGMWVWW